MRNGIQIAALVSIGLGLVTGCKYPPGGRPEPPTRTLGVWHRVNTGDTLSAIASRYETDRRTLAELNDLSDDAALQQQEAVFVPTGRGDPPGTGAAPVVQMPPDKPLPTTPKAASAPTRDACGQADRPCLLWPANGAVVGRFNQRGPNPHDGLDIAAKRGTPVVAAADGEVIYSGDAIEGYGHLVILRHAKELITVYAHNDANLVKEGNVVKRGAPIAKVGQSGSALKPHLHFEVRTGEAPRDPSLYLPFGK